MIENAKRNLLSVYLIPSVMAMFFLGIASGLPLALSASTLRIWLTEVGITTTTIGIFGLVATPYSLKFLWAPFIDNLNIPFLSQKLGRRRSWLMVSQLALASSITMLGQSDPTEDPFNTGMWAFIMAFCAATQDIVIDAYRIEILKKEEQGAGAALYVYGYRIGMLITTAGALLLSEYYSWSIVYLIAAFAISIGLVTALYVGEPVLAISNSWHKKDSMTELFMKMVVGPLADFTKRQGWVLILLFTIFFKFGDALAAAMTENFLLQVGFSKFEIAKIVKFFGLWASMFGAFIGGLSIYRLGMVKSLWLAGILQMLSNLLFSLQAMIGYSPELLILTIGVENTTSWMGNTIFVAYLSSLCNMSYTATQYALLSSLASFGRTFLSAPSGWLAETLGWAEYFVMSTFAALPGLALLYLITHSLRKKVRQKAV